MQRFQSNNNYVRNCSQKLYLDILKIAYKTGELQFTFGLCTAVTTK